MPIGPGIYDDLCTEARERARAAGCILIILGGACGSGFSCQASPAATQELPAFLRELADQIERDAPGPAPGMAPGIGPGPGMAPGPPMQARFDDFGDSEHAPIVDQDDRIADDLEIDAEVAAELDRAREINDRRI
jgi:hypothetical protein